MKKSFLGSSKAACQTQRIISNVSVCSQSYVDQYAASSLCAHQVTQNMIFVSFFYQVFLSSELQAAQIVSSRRVCNKGAEESPVCQELQAICETLNLPEPRGQDTAGVLSQVQDKVGRRASTFTSGPPTLESLL